MTLTLNIPHVAQSDGWSRKESKWLGRTADLLKSLADRVYVWGNLTPEMRLESLERALTVAIRRFGPDSRQASSGRGEVADQLEAMGRLTEAQLLWQQVLESFRSHRGPEHPSALIAEIRLGQSLKGQGFNGEAKSLFEHAYQVRVRTLGPDDERTLRAGSLLASVDESRGVDS
jgi:hypothetical protein